LEVHMLSAITIAPAKTAPAKTKTAPARYSGFGRAKMPKTRLLGCGCSMGLGQLGIAPIPPMVVTSAETALTVLQALEAHLDALPVEYNKFEVVVHGATDPISANWEYIVAEAYNVLSFSSHYIEAVTAALMDYVGDGLLALQPLSETLKAVAKQADAMFEFQLGKTVEVLRADVKSWITTLKAKMAKAASEGKPLKPSKSFWKEYQTPLVVLGCLALAGVVATTVAVAYKKPALPQSVGWGW
jgi:hypothetical protein